MRWDDPAFGVVLAVLLLALGGIVTAVVLRMRGMEEPNRFDRKRKTRPGNPAE